VRQEVGDLLGDLDRHVLLRLRGRGAEMRRADHVLAAEQHVVLRRLDREHVERRARDLPGVERLLEVLLDDQPAARAVDDAHALLHPRQRLGVDQVARGLGQRRVQGDEVGARWACCRDDAPLSRGRTAAIRPVRERGVSDPRAARDEALGDAGAGRGADRDEVGVAQGFAHEDV